MSQDCDYSRTYGVKYILSADLKIHALSFRQHDQIVVLRHECEEEVVRVRAPECGNGDVTAASV